MAVAGRSMFGWDAKTRRCKTRSTKVSDKSPEPPARSKTPQTP